MMNSYRLLDSNDRLSTSNESATSEMPWSILSGSQEATNCVSFDRMLHTGMNFSTIGAPLATVKCPRDLLRAMLDAMCGEH